VSGADFPPEGAQVILCNGHPWQGYTGTVTHDAPIPGTIAVELHEHTGTRAGVTDPAQVRVLPKSEQRT
jgi:hypothetical protein